jgi:hypothetical protein
MSYHEAKQRPLEQLVGQQIEKADTSLPGCRALFDCTVAIMACGSLSAIVLSPEPTAIDGGQLSTIF